VEYLLKQSMIDFSDIGLGTVFKLIKYLLKDFLYDIVCYVIGWFVLRVITVGKYPEEGVMYGVRDSETRESIPSLIGILVIFILSYLLFS